VDKYVNATQLMRYLQRVLIEKASEKDTTAFAAFREFIGILHEWPAADVYEAKPQGDTQVITVKEYCSSYKHILIVDNKPVCIVRGKKAIDNCVSYLMNGTPTLPDGKIMKILDAVRKEASE